MLDLNYTTRAVTSLDDISLTANTWKFFLKLSEQYASMYIKLTERFFTDNASDDMFDWLELAVTCLCEQIDEKAGEILMQVWLIWIFVNYISLLLINLFIIYLHYEIVIII